MEEFLDYLIKQIVTNPEEVKIEKEEKDGQLFFSIEVAEKDRGRLIGRGGNIINSLRHLLNIKAQKEGKQVFLRLNF
ncbi:KH domain-containing protein [Candidatus Shapirobacteria bacterium]|nr:KH domain-containing protein [Candidatus Shapirobacteria bacterium]